MKRGFHFVWDKGKRVTKVLAFVTAVVIFLSNTALPAWVSDHADSRVVIAAENDREVGDHTPDMAYVRRYAKGAAENEPDKTWGGLLTEWITGSVQFWNEVNDGIITYDKHRAEEYVQALREIIKTAHDEYEYSPPGRYNREGYNTYRRIEEDFDEYVLFLWDPSVPPTNNLCERHARVFKRKAGQAMSFRSQNGVDGFCDGLTITESLRAKGENVFDALTEWFNQGLEAWGY